MPMFCFTEPGPCSKFTFCKKEYTLWDHLVLKKSEDLQTIGDLVSKLEELIGGEVSMVTAGSVSLYIGFGLPVGLHSQRLMTQAALEKRKKTLLKDCGILPEKKGVKYIQLTVFAENDDDEEEEEEEEVPSILLEL